MLTPWYPLGFLSDHAALVVAFIVGVAFGWILERAGFGSARNLMGQFYGTDLRVLKVMFSAIMTAMLGLWACTLLGLVDPARIYLEPTYVRGDVVGGCVFGVGFVIAGYCPGTTIVGGITGRLDAALCLMGLVVGSWCAGWLEPITGDWMTSDDWGALTMPALWHVSPGLIILGAGIVAVGAMMMAEWVESRQGERLGQVSVWRRMGRPGRMVLPGILLAAVGLAWWPRPTLSVPTLVDAESVAMWMVQDPDLIEAQHMAEGLMAKTLRVYDVRTMHADGATIPGVESASLQNIARLPASPDDPIVLVAANEREGVPAWALLRARGCHHVQILAGGWTAWWQQVLHPALPEHPTSEQAEICAKRAAIARYFQGEPRWGAFLGAVPVASPSPTTPSSAISQPPVPHPRTMAGGCR